MSDDTHRMPSAPPDVAGLPGTDRHTPSAVCHRTGHPARATIHGGGETGEAIRARDWSTTLVGPIDGWPSALRVALDLVLNSRESMFVMWGPERTLFFNDAYRPMLGPRLPGALGADIAEVWADAWEQVRPVVERALAGEGSRFERMPLAMARYGEPERTWWTFSFSPLYGDSGSVEGMLGVTREVTEQILSEGRVRADHAALTQMFDQAPGFVAVLRGPDHRFELANRAYLRYIGGRDVIGQAVAEALPEAVDQGFVELLDRVYRTGEAFTAAGMRFTVQGEAGSPDDERHFDFVYQPLTGPDGEVTGVFVEGSDVTARTRGDAALRSSEERYRTLFEAIEVGFCIVEMAFEGGRATDYLIVEANPAFARQTGMDVVGRRVSEFAPNLERHWLDTYGRVAMTGEPAHFENHAEVFSRWFDVRALRIGAPEARRVAIFFSDITARRMAELRAETGERELRLVADALPVLIAFIDAGYVYRFANAAYQDWFFLPPERIVGRDLRDLLDADAWAARRRYVERALAGEAVHLELVWPRADGSHRDAEIRYLPRIGPDGSVEGFHVFVQDITDRKRVEVMLANRAETLALEVADRTAERDRMWRLSTDIMLVAEFDGTIVAVNPAWTVLFGWSEAELIKRSFMDLVHPDDAAGTLGAMGDLSVGTVIPRFENRYRHKDGSYRWLTWTAVPDERFIHAVGRDVTAEREAADALRRSEEALRQSQKMEAVGQLTGGIAHDFNNLLAGISGSLELMQTRMSQGRLNDLDRYMNAAQGAAKRAAALTHRLLAFSRRQTLDPKPTDVNRLIAGMEDLVRRTVGPAVAVEVVGASGLWSALVDPPQLENALLNLCINARDAMPDGGRITVETANRWLDDRGAMERDLPPGQYLSLCVSDTGSGMPAEVIAKAFEPFFTTKPIGQGTGLGLSMIHGFARQSGGQVRIYSEVGHGTTVCIYLPRHYGEAGRDDTNQGLERAPRAEQGETVLIIDDEPTVRMLVSEVLEDLGYTAVEAADGPSGLKVLQSDLRIDLLVTDVGLPGGMNGRQVADAARVNRPDLKVLFITGYAENAAVGGGHLDAGMQVLTKPFAIEAMASRIRQMIEGGT